MKTKYWIAMLLLAVQTTFSASVTNDVVGNWNGTLDTLNANPARAKLLACRVDYSRCL